MRFDRVPRPAQRGPWRYSGPDSFLLMLHQTHTCARCGAEEKQDVERAF